MHIAMSGSFRLEPFRLVSGGNLTSDPTWMWAQACELLEQAEKLHRAFFHPHRGVAAGPVWEPPLDMIETRDQLRLTVVLPGVAARSVQVTAGPQTLIVSGERPLAIDPDHAVIHRLEIPYGRFERRITLPQGSYRLDKVRHQDGCVDIWLRKDG